MGRQDLLLLLGDFNQPLISWSRVTAPSRSSHLIPSGDLSSTFLDVVRFHELLQVSDVRNSRERQLDLVFTNDAASTCTVTPASCLLLPVDAYHPPFEFSIPEPALRLTCTDPLRSSNNAPSLNFRKTDYRRLSVILECTDWSFLFSCTSVDAAVSFFNSSVSSALQCCTPIFKPRPSPPWSNRSLQRLKSDKNRYRRAYHRNRTSFNKRLF